MDPPLTILSRIVKGCQGLAEYQKCALLGLTCVRGAPSRARPCGTPILTTGRKKFGVLGLFGGGGPGLERCPPGPARTLDRTHRLGATSTPATVHGGLGAGVPRKRAAILACCVCDIWPCSPVCGLWGHKAVSMRRLQASWGPLTIRDNP